ncbi:type III deoxyribonuclease [Rothia sp. Olga]|nr:type III deoxyribonuclease [Rothia sp. Olga]
MQIRLQTLDHQQRALTALTHVFHGVDIDRKSILEANPVFDPSDPQIVHNIHELQNGVVEGIESIPSSWRQKSTDETHILGVDIKMETGTGKTLVYTQFMYELNRLYGFTKFIILVPSTPIREGTQSFITSDYARQYFDDVYGGRINLRLDVLESQKRSKGRKMFPNAVTNFVQASRLTEGRISALLMTDKMLQSKATMGTVYDQTVLGMSSNPYEALRETRPIIIIDEPHRFRRENKAYQTIVNELQPQAIFRFGATFPEKPNVKKKTIDYNNLIFNLGAVEAFNEQLVKGVAIQYPEDTDKKSARLRLTSISKNKPKTANFDNLDTKKTLTLRVGDSLAEASGDFSGITVESIGKTENTVIKSGVTLSNGQILALRDIITAQIYSETYQSLMMKRAIDNHFETEWENFQRITKVKTLTLFFIDSITSYRGEDGPGHLRLHFEKLLKDKLTREIARHKQESSGSTVRQQYVEYLQASLTNLQATNGGYFSDDNSSRDEDIKNEVDKILRDKQSLLSFINPDGTPNTMRFIFSKWTLREGWDNPNVFQIVKLRSSGSEISKLQEVGRGLRLPVDVNGTRLSDEQFYLTYLVDYTEESFAHSLVSEINSDTTDNSPKIKELLPKVAAVLNMDETQLFIELLTKKLVDTDKNVIEGKESELYDAYPEFNVGGVKPDKVVKNKDRAKVGIRKDRYYELKQLWDAVNAKYYLQLDNLTTEEIDECLDDILGKDIYRRQQGRITQDRLNTDGNREVTVTSSTKDIFDIHDTLPYSEWLKQAHQQTYLPIGRIHAALVRYNAVEKLPDLFFNKGTLSEFVAQFNLWMQENFINRFSYTRIDGPVGKTALTDVDGKPLKNIVQGNVGIYRDQNAEVPDKFLYDAFIYDSPKEQENIRDSVMDEIVVYGKIPRRSIRVPIYFGGTSSPDFMYVLKTKDGKLSLNFVIETKDYNSEGDLRLTEKRRIEAAQKFFDSIKSNEDIQVKFAPQLKRDGIQEMLENVLRTTQQNSQDNLDQ